MGYGFLLLFNGREYKDLKASGDAAGVGSRDAAAAVRAAASEGFRSAQSFFSIRSREAACFPSNAPIFMPGSTAL